MKFKKINSLIWRVEFNKKNFTGTWEECSEFVKKIKI